MDVVGGWKANKQQGEKWNVQGPVSLSREHMRAHTHMHARAQKKYAGVRECARGQTPRTCQAWIISWSSVSFTSVAERNLSSGSDSATRHTDPRPRYEHCPAQSVMRRDHSTTTARAARVLPK